MGVNGLFTMGYNIYVLGFLLISTAGVPVAVAKQVAKYTPENKPIKVLLDSGFLEVHGNSRPWICHSHVSFVSCLC